MNREKFFDPRKSANSSGRSASISVQEGVIWGEKDCCVFGLFFISVPFGRMSDSQQARK